MPVPARTEVLLFGAAVAIVAVVHAVRKRLKEQRRKQYSRTGFGQETEELTPPLPPEVVRLLKSTSLCHLSTQGTDGTPHLSLMRFTYLRSEEKIVMSTRMNSQKFSLLLENPSVALLVHDFPQMQGEGGHDECGRTFSITLSGRATVESGEAEEGYRNLHLKENPEYEQFIVGDDIAIVTVSVTSARICNVNDKVKVWSLEKAREGLC